MQYLKDKPATLPEAWMFLTGIERVPAARRVAAEGPAADDAVFRRAAARCRATQPDRTSAQFDEYVSDPNQPVPYVGYIAAGMTGDYMTEDQRFAASGPTCSSTRRRRSTRTDHRRTDQGAAARLDHRHRLRLRREAHRRLSRTTTRRRQRRPGSRCRADAVKMGGYQQLVRGEPFRGKFRNSFEKPEPFVPASRRPSPTSCPTSTTRFARGTG